MFCLLLLSSCEYSINVQQQGQFGYVSFSMDANVTDVVCTFYSDANAPLTMDEQFRMAQIAAFLVIPLGFVMIVFLLLVPCFRNLNGIWPKIVGLALALVTAILQLLSVVKFLRFFLSEFKDDDVYYESRFVVYGSVVFWLLTIVAICICGVKQRAVIIPYEKSHKDPKSDGKINRLSEEKVLDITAEHDELEELEIVKSFSGQAREANEAEDGTGDAALL